MEMKKVGFKGIPPLIRRVDSFIAFSQCARLKSDVKQYLAFISSGRHDVYLVFLIFDEYIIDVP